MKPQIEICQPMKGFWFVEIRYDREAVVIAYGKSKSDAIQIAKQELTQFINELGTETHEAVDSSDESKSESLSIEEAFNIGLPGDSTLKFKNLAKLNRGN